MYYNRHNMKGIGDPKTFSPKKEKKPIKVKRKVTGEREIHLAIWAVRKHVSYFSGDNLDHYVNEKNEPLPHLFAHVLPKSTYPKFRLVQKNIVLLTPQEHDTQGNVSRDKWNPKFREDWERLENELKEMYAQKHPTK